MKETELRIGNYLQDSKGRLCKVESIEFDSQNGHKVNAPVIIGSLTTLPNIEIPLTEEWLLKFGFESESPNVWHNYIALYGNGNGEYNYNAAYFEHDNLIAVKYVHQLQNLYHALTGEELTIKEKAKS